VSGSTALGISAEFSVLKAAYESGSRALISWIGDSTVAHADGLLEQSSTACYLREFLAAAGLAGVIGGSFSSGDKGLTLTGRSMGNTISPTRRSTPLSPGTRWRRRLSA
jgi:hypothetical protein